MSFLHDNRVLLLGILLASVATGAHAVTCGEASCVPAQGAYISHFSGPNCTGTESYYLPYDNSAYQCRTWDGTGQCGTSPHPVSNRSYRDSSGCHPDAWPAGNSLENFVTVYRTTTDPCTEASCNLAQAAYISHFSGPGCTGTESYYLPYDGYAYQCRTWDGKGQCGTVQRSVTARSYLYNGTCYDAWADGNPLTGMVTVYRPADGDGDGIPDSLELALAQRFFPVLNLHCGTYEGLAYGDKRQLYGLDVPGYTNSKNGRLPFVAYPYNPGNGVDCDEPFQCIEIRYGVAWNWDLGDDVGNDFGFGTSHRGDSEMYAVLLARKDTDGADWGVDWATAQNDPSQWRLITESMNAHDGSSFRSQGNFGTSTVQRVWCSEGKHGMYATQSACNDGGFYGSDDCSDNRCDITTELFQKVQNVGQSWAPLQYSIPYPGADSTTPPSGTYNVWSGDPFGSSDATAYKTHFTHPINWCPAHCY
jgi:hypothetical protein